MRTMTHWSEHGTWTGQRTGISRSGLKNKMNEYTPQKDKRHFFLEHEIKQKKYFLRRTIQSLTLFL